MVMYLIKKQLVTVLRKGVLMKKRLLSYIEYANSEVERSDIDKAAFREQLLIQIQFFQHERLVHLIVTVTFAILFMMTAGLFFITENMSLLLLGGLFLLLLIPYISHYYLLENGVQKLYTVYDKTV